MDLEIAKVSAKEMESAAAVGLPGSLQQWFNQPWQETTYTTIDRGIAANVLGHFYLTKLLLPLLLATAKRTPEGKARVIVTFSLTHVFVNGIRFKTLTDCVERKKMGTTRLYYQSKFGSVLFAIELHHRYAAEGIVAMSLHPGSEDGATAALKLPGEGYRCAIVLYPAPLGALSQLRAGTTPEGLTYGGKYLIPWARVGEARKETADTELAKRLWEWLEAQVAQV